MPTPFKNCLRKGDVVLHVTRNRRGIVHNQPRDTSRNTLVRFDGTNSGQPVDVMELRLIVPGSDQAEDVPPVEGEPTQKLSETFGSTRLPAEERVAQGLFDPFNREWNQRVEEPGLRTKQIRRILSEASDEQLAGELRQPSTMLTWAYEMTVREALARILTKP